MDKKRSISIMPERVGLAEYKFQYWIADAAEGTTKEDILQPSYWAFMAQQFKPYDEIKVRAEDGTWIAELLVTGCDRTWAKTHLLAYHPLTTGDVAETQSVEHQVKYRGPHHKWSVVRLSDREPIKNGFQTPEEATHWMREHERVL